MPPRPFPYAIGIGTDICHIPRIQRIILQNDGRDIVRFGSKIFNDFELRFFQQKLTSYHEAKAAAVSDSAGNGAAVPNKPVLHNTDDVRHHVGLVAFAQWLAGRFAAKEAAIKAVYHRRLLYRDITIRTSDKGFGPRPYAVIDPPERLVKIPYSIAMERGISMNKETDFAYRRKQVLANERQIAEVSISHDGEYATAVVMAANDLVKYDTGHVIDEGGPYALHEPSLHDDFKVMDNSQLRWFAKTGTLAPLTRQKDEGDVSLRPRRIALLAELRARGIDTGLENDPNVDFEP